MSTVALLVSATSAVASVSLAVLVWFAIASLNDDMQPGAALDDMHWDE